MSHLGRFYHELCDLGREFRAILAVFCLNLVAMATPLTLLKFQIAYLNLLTPKTLLFV